MSKPRKKWPRTVEEAVNRLIQEMSEEDRETLKNTPEKDLIMYHFSLGMWVRNEFGLWQGNEELLKSCATKEPFIHPDDASSIIIEELWKKLNKN